ncbi:MAG: hypothetical protein OSB12_05780 [Planctomycetota bacterium]|nr:hypothetical protein [Planctomycetota bacterium]
MFEMLRDQRSSPPSREPAAPEQKGSDPSVSSQPSSTTEEPVAPLGSGSRLRVDLDDRAKQIPQHRHLSEIPEASSSAEDDRFLRSRDTFLTGTVEIRRATLLVFGIAALLLMALSYMSGNSTAPVQEPAGIAEMDRTPLSDDPQWPLLDPEPGGRPAIRNIVQQAVAPSATDPAVDASVVPAVADMERVPLQQSLYAVWIGQHLSKDPAVIDKLVQYVDSGLTTARARVRISESGAGKRFFSVFVGPFENLDAARSALREIQVLRPHQGVRFRDAFPTKMVFTSDELQKFETGY